MTREQRPAFTLRDLPEWVKSFGLPPEAQAAIDRYWQPAWDEIKDLLPLLPVHDERAPAAVEAPVDREAPTTAAAPLRDTEAPATATPPIDAALLFTGTPVQIHFTAVHEPVPGRRWQARFDDMWPAYRAWYLQEGEQARPDLATCRQAMTEHMPELLSVYERLIELARGDQLAARCLSLWNPPAFIVGCSQAAVTRGRPVLVRNYDYPASRLEGVVLKTRWAGRRVIGMSDCLWGLLDGINDAGLAVSLTFGGRRVTGEGFAIPLVVRYVLETCDSVAQAREALTRLPVHAAQNLTMLDRSGESATVYLGPDHAPRFADTMVTTNHQAEIDWPEYVSAVHSVEREQHLLSLLGQRRLSSKRLVAAFLEPPLYTASHAQGWGTLYTAAYYPAGGRAEYRWPGHQWTQSFRRFEEAAHTQLYR